MSQQLNFAPTIIWPNTYNKKKNITVLESPCITVPFEWKIIYSILEFIWFYTTPDLCYFFFLCIIFKLNQSFYPIRNVLQYTNIHTYTHIHTDLIKYLRSKKIFLFSLSLLNYTLELYARIPQFSIWLTTMLLVKQI